MLATGGKEEESKKDAVENVWSTDNLLNPDIGRKCLIHVVRDFVHCMVLDRFLGPGGQFCLVVCLAVIWTVIHLCHGSAYKRVQQKVFIDVISLLL